MRSGSDVEGTAIASTTSPSPAATAVGSSSSAAWQEKRPTCRTTAGGADCGAAGAEAAPSRNHGWHWISAVVMRQVGSRVSMWWIRSAVEGVTQPGIVKRPVQTLPSSRLVFSSSNGRSPVRSAKRTTPLDQTSACLPT